MQLALGLSASTVTTRSGATARSRARPSVTSRSGSAPAPPRSAQAGGLGVYLAAIVSGAVISVAWWFPNTYASALLGWVAAFLLVFTLRARRSYLPAYCCGLACCALGFYWIYGTVAVFGGVGTILAALVFTCFVVFSAVQFLLLAFIHHNLGPAFDALAVRSPTALVVSELVSVRLFYWHYGHTQIALTPFVQVADLGGAMLVSFIMFWLAEVVVRVIVEREWRRSFLLPLLVLAGSLVYGFVRIHTFSSPRGKQQNVILVQGNIAPAPKYDSATARHDFAKYDALSRQAARSNALIVWPEGAVPEFIPARIKSAQDLAILPWNSDGSAYLIGSYSQDQRERFYNAAFAIDPHGEVLRPYFKQILIPFGEYIPFVSIFPWLGALNPDANVLSAGSEIKVWNVSMRGKDGTRYALKASPLICYEDTVPALACQATLAGAELLVNLTYDTWFGRSAAPYEHHLIAAFRAIENRRYLVRATNSGLSAVVDPLGRTIAQLPAFSEGTLSSRIVLMNDQSMYTRFVRERPWWALAAVAFAVVIKRRRANS